MSIKHKYSYKTVSAFMKDYKKGLISLQNISVKCMVNCSLFKIEFS